LIFLLKGLFSGRKGRGTGAEWQKFSNQIEKKVTKPVFVMQMPVCIPATCKNSLLGLA
jgi:hypothetical protein